MYKETTDLERTALFIATMEAQKRDRIAQLKPKTSTKLQVRPLTIIYSYNDVSNALLYCSV